MVEPPKSIPPTAESLKPTLSIGNGTKNANLIYVPRQVFMSDNNLSNTTTSLVTVPKVIIRKNSKIASIKSEDNDQHQEPGSSKINGSPLMEGSVCNFPTSVTAANVMYVPRQVFMSDNNLSNTTTSLVTVPKVIIRKKSKIASIKSEDNGQHQESGSSKTTSWSPLMDGINCNLPTSVTGYTNSSHSKTEKGSKEENGEMVGFDDYIDAALYGHGKSSLPVFENLCRE